MKRRAETRLPFVGRLGSSDTKGKSSVRRYTFPMR
jgi:hypothetical protein